MTMKQRNPVYDIAKFVVMLFVVHGHVPHLFGANAAQGMQSGMSWFSNLNIGMAMPFFFIVSGYFSALTINKGEWIDRLRRLLWPMLSFGVVVGFVRLCVGELPVWKAVLWPFHELVYGPWFLRTLAIVFVIHALTWRFAHAKFRLMILLLIYVVLFLLPREGCFFWTERVMHMFPYFTFGMVAMRTWHIHERDAVAIPMGLLFAATVLFEGNVKTNGMGFYWVESDWMSVVSSKHLLFCFFARTVVGICGSVFFLWVVDKIRKIIPRVDLVAVFGTTTLGVYLLHEWPLAMIGRHFVIEVFPSWLQWLLTFGIFFSCHYIVAGINRSRMLKMFFFGDNSCSKQNA